MCTHPVTVYACIVLNNYHEVLLSLCTFCVYTDDVSEMLVNEVGVATTNEDIPRLSTVPLGLRWSALFRTHARTVATRTHVSDYAPLL